MSDLSEVKIFSGENSKYIAEKIAKSLNLDLGQKTLLHFSDGEFATSYDETVRGDHVFIVQSTFPPSDNLMELLMMIDAAKRASAYKVVAVIPYFGFARQDRKDRPRVAIGAKLVANLLCAAGVDRIMTMDLHADQIQGILDSRNMEEHHHDAHHGGGSFHLAGPPGCNDPPLIRGNHPQSADGEFPNDHDQQRPGRHPSNLDKPQHRRRHQHFVRQGIGKFSEVCYQVILAGNFTVQHIRKAGNHKDCQSHIVRPREAPIQHSHKHRD